MSSIEQLASLATVQNIGAIGSKEIVGTSKVSAENGAYFFAIQVTADMIVAGQENVTGATNMNLSLITGGIPAGTVIYGKFSSITLTSGQAIGYYARS